VTAAQRYLSSKPSYYALKLLISLFNSLIAGNSCGDGCDLHCVASQAVQGSEKNGPHSSRKAYQWRAFVIRRPVSVLPISRNREYSRFWETAAGDRVRSRRVVAACMAAGLVKGEGFAVVASVMEANASRYHGKAPDQYSEYLHCGRN
jgi:hypothetical protein